MYEMLEMFKIVNRNNDEINTFHACEAPGNFILAFNHFIKTKTKIKKFNWYAQTYNPKTKMVDKSEVLKDRYGDIESIGDDFGIIKKYKERWDFGKDGIGDITKPENIEYYKADPSLLKEQGNNSYKATFELFNKKYFIENHQNFYQSVVESHYENRPRK